MTETKIKPSSILVLATAAGFASVAMAADPVPDPAAAPAKPVTFVDAVTGGKAHLEFRYRLESVDQDPFADDALASTLRSRLNEIVRALGYEPGKDEGPVQLSSEDRREILERLDRGEISWEEAQARLRGEKYVEQDAASTQGGK